MKTTVNSGVERVWAAWVQPEHITNWNFASDQWHCPSAEIELVEGGRFSYRMEAKDGSTGFDFAGQFTRVEEHKLIEYMLEDDRRVSIDFTETSGSTSIVERFEAEDEFSGEQQRQGWQSILDNFKIYVEALRT